MVEFICSSQSNLVCFLMIAFLLQVVLDSGFIASHAHPTDCHSFLEEERVLAWVYQPLPFGTTLARSRFDEPCGEITQA